MGKLGNIVETFVILDVSLNVSVCPPVETLRKQNLLPEKQNCFLANSETFDVSLCFSLMFPRFAHSGKHGETLAGNNVSATMFPCLPRALDYNTHLSQLMYAGLYNRRIGLYS